MVGNSCTMRRLSTLILCRERHYYYCGRREDWLSAAASLQVVGRLVGLALGVQASAPCSSNSVTTSEGVG